MSGSIIKTIVFSKTKQSFLKTIENETKNNCLTKFRSNCKASVCVSDFKVSVCVSKCKVSVCVAAYVCTNVSECKISVCVSDSKLTICERE